MVTAGFRAQIASAVEATRIESDTRFSWFGRSSSELPRSVKRCLDRATARHYLLNALQHHLYASFYTQGVALPAPPPAAGLPVVGIASLTAQFAAVNTSRGCWQDGWLVTGLDAQRLYVRRGGLTFSVSDRNDIRATGEATPLGVGASVEARMPHELTGMSPGFYMASGEHAMPDEAQPVRRLYFNLTTAGAVRFVATAVESFNAAGVPFTLKALSDPADYVRCDVAVLYLNDSTQDVTALVRRLHREIASELGLRVPALTRRLAPGVGFAEDPGERKSFGQHRCRLLAEAILQAHERGKRTLAARLRVVDRVFEDGGVAAEAPFLNAGSDGGALAALDLAVPGRLRVPPRAAPREAELLSAAIRVGRNLCDEAVWHATRCNWLGMLPETPDPGEGAVEWKYSALGANFYAGTAGVAWFLGRLHAQTGEHLFKKTARGAIRQALSIADSVPRSQRLGLYSGWLGIALASIRLGMAFEEPALVRAGTGLANRIDVRRHRREEFDLLSGSASAVVGCLALARLLDRPAWLERAVQFGNRLVRSANKRRHGYSWRGHDFPSARDLTGFSHGTAGAGYALLELHAATNDEAYRHAADRAFEYERRKFDPVARNWADLRDLDRLRPASSGTAFATVWCHGAPGITVSRLRAYELLRDESLRLEATIGFDTTRRIVEGMLATPGSALSLCHGLAGNCAVLLYGAEVLGLDSSGIRELALEACARVLPVGGSRDPWLAGAELGDNPSVMLGRAGIGWLLLHVAGKDLANPILPHRL
jgi:hypothetical protein